MKLKCLSATIINYIESISLSNEFLSSKSSVSERYIFIEHIMHALSL